MVLPRRIELLTAIWASWTLISSGFAAGGVQQRAPDFDQATKRCRARWQIRLLSECSRRPAGLGVTLAMQALTTLARAAYIAGWRGAARLPPSRAERPPFLKARSAPPRHLVP